VDALRLCFEPQTLSIGLGLRHHRTARRARRRRFARRYPSIIRLVSVTAQTLMIATPATIRARRSCSFAIVLGCRLLDLRAQLLNEAAIDSVLPAARAPSAVCAIAQCGDARSDRLAFLS
jgi:hypothetical protein